MTFGICQASAERVLTTPQGLQILAAFRCAALASYFDDGKRGNSFDSLFTFAYTSVMSTDADTLSMMKRIAESNDRLSGIDRTFLAGVLWEKARKEVAASIAT
jgi:hypothetical protein